jgi:hypothetical protein
MAAPTVRATVAVLVIAASLGGAVAIWNQRTTTQRYCSYCKHHHAWAEPLAVFVAAAGTGVGLVLLRRGP